ncbi:MAG: alpha/beta hydrolase [Faecalibacterium sp.]|nr:alpha/beta hydrolase [Faecalibacterium sp.]
MPLSAETRAIMARDMQSNRKFDGETDIPVECRGFGELATCETVEMPAVLGWPYKLYIFTAQNAVPNCPVHINIHGGGFLIGHMPNDSLWSAWLADRINGIVVDVDYTTTEYASHPVAMEQCRDAARYTYAHCAEWNADPKRISMGGYSAGGTLTMGVAMQIKDTVECPLCLLVNGYGPGDMRYQPEETQVPEFWKTQQHRGAGFGVLIADDDPAVLEQPELYHLGASDEQLRGLPATLILSAEKCGFRFQNEELGKRLASLGVEVTMKRYPDTVHGFIPHFMAHWEEAADLIVRAIKGASL